MKLVESTETVAIDPQTTVVLGVALLHLVSGEDMVGRVEYDAENKVYTIERPVSPMLSPKPDGTGISIALMPYRPFLDADEPLLIRDANVLFVGKVQDKLEKHYLQVTSGIAIADPASVSNIRG